VKISGIKIGNSFKAIQYALNTKDKNIWMQKGMTRVNLLNNDSGCLLANSSNILNWWDWKTEED